MQGVGNVIAYFVAHICGVNTRSICLCEQEKGQETQYNSDEFVHVRVKSKVNLLR